jgi:hypothetical protein
MSEFGKVCEHGSLARQCLVCELQAELSRLKDELANAHKASEAIEKERTDLFHRNEKLEAVVIHVLDVLRLWKEGKPIPFEFMEKEAKAALDGNGEGR